jgi:hypothetical protein
LAHYVQIPFAHQVASIAKLEQLALGQIHDLVIDINQRRCKTDGDAALTGLHRNRFIDRCVRPLWRTRNLSRLYEEV